MKYKRAPDAVLRRGSARGVLPPVDGRRVAALRRRVWAHWRAHGRHDLPWRTTSDPYRILVSEVMLQQTQVERVIPFYERFLQKFPTAHALAQAPLSDVLRAWSGLGYNRRAKLLQATARAVVERYGGTFPVDEDALVALPGIGPYTAGAVRAFAFNQPGVFIETNIRTVIFHHTLLLGLSSSPDASTQVRDAEMMEVVRALSAGQDPRTWYAALMDYGAYLKKSGVRLNEKSAHYAKQSVFEGSHRQARGAILRAVANGPRTLVQIRRHAAQADLVLPAERITAALSSLERDGLIERTGTRWRLHESSVL